MGSGSIRKIILLWLGWAAVLLSFQTFVQMRLDLKRPDEVLSWTSQETQAFSSNDSPYLIEPFLNSQVAWDSEYYLAIAAEGYDLAKVTAIPQDFAWGGQQQRFCEADPKSGCYALSYAFFPLYSFLTRLVAFPIGLFNLTTTAQYTLAAVIVSLCGTLLAMLSLHSLCRESLGEEGALKAVFYLLIFPSGFFLAQVYTEGIFIGIVFAALAILNKRKWAWAALFGALASWARPGGAILLLPFLMVWWQDQPWKSSKLRAAVQGLAALSPALSYFAWSMTPLGERFFLVERLYFGRGLLALGRSLAAWQVGFDTLLHGSAQGRFYYSLEFACVLMAIVTCFLLIKEKPFLAWYGLAMIAFAFTSGSAQGMVRYVLVVPCLFWMLAKWGKSQVFDRVWTLASLLLMGLEALLFTFNFWVA